MKPFYLLIFKIAWSAFWRGLPLYILLISCIYLGETNLSILHPELTYLGVIFCITLGVMGLLYIDKWIFNRLPSLSYKEGQVILMKDKISLHHFSLFYTLCASWSHIWRYGILDAKCQCIEWVLSITFGFPPFFTSLDYSFLQNILELTPQSAVLPAISLIIVFLLTAVAYHWMFCHKKTGRWVRIDLK